MRKCIECGKRGIARRKTDVKMELRGMSFAVPGIADECVYCGDQSIPLQYADELGAALDAQYRRKMGLLSKDEIREARERLGMSQEQFAAYLGVGIASVKRWESGALPDKSSDDLIRLKTGEVYAQRNLDELRKRLHKPVRLTFVFEPDQPVYTWV